MKELAQRLTDTHGPNPQYVGQKDGTEDDYGDLLMEAFEGLGYDFDDTPDEVWQAFQGAAATSTSTTMEAWLDDLRRIMTPAQ